MEESSLEELDGDDGEDEVEQHVDDHDVDDVLERVDDAVEHSLHARQHHHAPARFTLQHNVNNADAQEPRNAQQIQKIALEKACNRE